MQVGHLILRYVSDTAGHYSSARLNKLLAKDGGQCSVGYLFLKSAEAFALTVRNCQIVRPLRPSQPGNESLVGVSLHSFAQSASVLLREDVDAGQEASRMYFLAQGKGEWRWLRTHV